MGSHELTVARMAALLGDMAEASMYFARAELEARDAKLTKEIASQLQLPGQGVIVVLSSQNRGLGKKVR